MTRRLRFPSLAPALRRAGATLALTALGAFAAAPAGAQPLVLDDFEAGFAGEFVFSGGEDGLLSLSAMTPDGSANAASFFADADEYGGFTGFGQPLPGGPADVTGVENPVLVFDLAPTGSFNLEINLQNTGGGGEGEIRAVLRFDNANGTYQRYRLALGSLLPTNQATFDFDDVFQYVWTIAGATGDGNTATAETGFLLDNIQVESGLGFENALVGESFDSGDFSDTNGFFYFSGGDDIAAMATTDTPDGSANAFSGTIDGDAYGGFAGFGATFDAAPINATQYDSFNFFLRTTGPGLMEVNLQTGAAAGGNEGREVFRLEDTAGEYVRYSIPIEGFVQSSANAPDFSQVFNFVLTFVQLPGDGNVGSREFTFDVDAMGFGTQAPPVAAQDVPVELALAPRAYPNPTTGAATIAFDLTVASDVTVDVVDVLGRRVARLAEGPRAAGTVRLTTSAAGLAPGLYLVRVRTDSGVVSTQLTVTR